MSSITLFFLFIPILAFILLIVNFTFAPHTPYQEKGSTFECGFHSFLGQNRTQFSVSFFIFALLFLLFDLEILLVYPYVVSANGNGLYGLIIMLIFLLVLTLGFAFELGKNALKIDSKQDHVSVNLISVANIDPEIIKLVIQVCEIIIERFREDLSSLFSLLSLLSLSGINLDYDLSSYFEIYQNGGIEQKVYFDKNISIKINDLGFILDSNFNNVANNTIKAGAEAYCKYKPSYNFNSSFNNHYLITSLFLGAGWNVATQVFMLHIPNNGNNGDGHSQENKGKNKITEDDVLNRLYEDYYNNLADYRASFQRLRELVNTHTHTLSQYYLTVLSNPTLEGNNNSLLLSNLQQQPENIRVITNRTLIDIQGLNLNIINTARNLHLNLVHLDSIAENITLQFPHINGLHFSQHRNIPLIDVWGNQLDFWSYSGDMFSILIDYRGIFFNVVGDLHYSFVTRSQINASASAAHPRLNLEHTSHNDSDNNSSNYSDNENSSDSENDSNSNNSGDNSN